MRPGRGPFGFASATSILLALAVCIAARAAAGTELLLNGNLAKGSGGQPDEWRTEAWINDPAACSFHWTHPPAGGPGELEVEAVKADDARWMQSLSLGAGFYYFSAEIRTEQVGQQDNGANISVMEDGIMSSDLKGTTGWTRVGFYLKVGSKGADIDVALRLGGYGSLNTGRAFFRNASALRIDSLPAGAQPVYDLEAIRKAAEPVPVGSPISLAATFLGLAMVAWLGWRMIAQQPPKTTRAEVRREAKRAQRR